MVVKSASKEGVISEDVLKFAQEHRIVEHVEQAMNAAREVFTDARSVTACLKRDAEFGYLYVDVHVVLSENDQPEAAAEKDSDCIARWAHHVPPDLGELIRHSSSWTS